MTVTADGARLVFTEAHLSRWWVRGGVGACAVLAVVTAGWVGAANPSASGLLTGAAAGAGVWLLPPAIILAASRYRSAAVDLRTGDVETTTV